MKVIQNVSCYIVRGSLAVKELDSAEFMDRTTDFGTPMTEQPWLWNTDEKACALKLQKLKLPAEFNALKLKTHWPWNVKGQTPRSLLIMKYFKQTLQKNPATDSKLMLTMSNFLGSSFKDQINECYFKKKSEISRSILGDVFLTLFLKPTCDSFWEECVSHWCSVLAGRTSRGFCGTQSLILLETSR